jgi:2-phosphosulfolactate phosphatase
MKVRTYFSPAEASSAEMQGATAVVMDVIRATSTIIEALAAGARAVYPTISTEDAIRLATSLGRKEALICGERKGLKIDGFDLGNSPAEFTQEKVGGKQLVMTTTNGTRAFLAAEQAERVVCSAFVNLSATARAVRDVEDLVFVCAGKEDRFALDDALCAGMILRSLLGEATGEGIVGEVVLDDASRTALDLARAHEPTVEFLAETAAGASLVAVGLATDIPLCARVDLYDFVPTMRERRIQL